MARLAPTWEHPDRARGPETLDDVASPRVVDPGVHPETGSVDRSAPATVLTGDDVDEAAARLAASLRRRDVDRGDAVAWSAANRWETLALYRACWRLGAVAVPVHHQAGPAERDAIIGRIGPTLVVDLDEVPSLIQESRDEGRTVAPGTARPDDLAVVLHSSGSSGEPKGVLHTHAGLAVKARLMTAVHDLGADDTILMPAPLAHISGLQNGLTVPGAAGMTVVLMARWDADVALDLIEAHRVTFMIGPPTFFVSLRHAAGFRPERVRTIRLISCGGAGVTPAFVADTSAAFDAVVKRTYGSTEAPTVTTSYAGDDPERAAATDGRATGAMQLRIGPGGEVWVRGPELFVGYTDPARTAEAVSEGWFRTGDVGTLDDEGWLTIVGRTTDLIIRGGENISAAEVEAALEAHPAIRQAVAVGEPDERLGERVCAFVVVAPGAAIDVDACRTWFAERGLARFKVPQRVVTVTELPLRPAGKIDRAALRARAAELAATPQGVVLS